MADAVSSNGISGVSPSTATATTGRPGRRLREHHPGERRDAGQRLQIGDALDPAFTRTQTGTGCGSVLTTQPAATRRPSPGGRLVGHRHGVLQVDDQCLAPRPAAFASSPAAVTGNVQVRRGDVNRRHRLDQRLGHDGAQDVVGALADAHQRPSRGTAARPRTRWSSRSRRAPSSRRSPPPGRTSEPKSSPCRSPRVGAAALHRVGRPVRHQARRLQVGRERRELELDRLELGDGLPERLALLGVLQRQLVRAAARCRPSGRRCSASPFQRRQRLLEPMPSTPPRSRSFGTRTLSSTISHDSVPL